MLPNRQSAEEVGHLKRTSNADARDFRRGSAHERSVIELNLTGTGRIEAADEVERVIWHSTNGHLEEHGKITQHMEVSHDRTEQKDLYPGV